MCKAALRNSAQGMLEGFPYAAIMIETGELANTLIMSKSTHYQPIVLAHAAAYCCGQFYWQLSPGRSADNVPFIHRCGSHKSWAPYYPSEDVLTFDQYLHVLRTAHQPGARDQPVPERQIPEPWLLLLFAG